MLGHEDDVLGAKVDSGTRPLVRIQVLWIDLSEWCTEVVGFRVLPGIRREMHEHAQFQILPRDLIGRRHGTWSLWGRFTRCLAHESGRRSGYCPTQSCCQSKLRGSHNHLTSLHSSLSA